MSNDFLGKKNISFLQAICNWFCESMLLNHFYIVEEATIEKLDIADSNAVSASSSTNVPFNNVNGVYIEGTSVWVKCTARTGEQFIVALLQLHVLEITIMSLSTQSWRQKYLINVFIVAFHTAYCVTQSGTLQNGIIS